MANTITNLIPTLYEALDVVSREMVGFIPAVSRNSAAEQVAKNQTVNIPIVPAITADDVAPGVSAPNDGDQTFGNTTMTISKSRYAPIRWNGEEQLAVGQTGQYNRVLRDQFAQAMRVLVNEVEGDLAALYVNASRSYGSATVPFGTAGDLSDLSQTLRILQDNGAPQTDLQAVFGSGAFANLRGKQSVLFKVNEAGTAELLREGILGRLEGADLHVSSQVKRHTKGTAASATTNTAGYAVGATAITLAAAGTGTILAGDSITFAGDTNQYVVATGVGAVSGGSITLAAPGLLQAIPAAATDITVVATAPRNMIFSRSAIQLATRLPAMPAGGDSADDVTEIVDPVSGLAFQVARYSQYRQVRFEVGLAWGVKAVKAAHIALLCG